MKKIYLSFALLFLMNTVFSQTFMHGAGLTVLVTSANGETSVGEGLTYSPRFNFIENENMSVSVGIPLTVGFTFSTNAYSSDYYNDDPTSIGVVVNVPVMVNLNMGRGSTKENRQKFGYFVGAGFGYHHGDFITDSYDYDDVYTNSTNTFGPAANAGMRFGVGRQHRNIEVRFSYMKGINEQKPNIFGVGCLFNF